MANTDERSLAPVLVAVDLESHSLTALRRGVELARLERRPLLVLHVVHENAESAGFYHRHNARGAAVPMRDVAQLLLEGLLARALEGDGSIQVRTLVVEGVPAGRICEVAEREDAAVVVMAGRPRHGIDRLWHGSVTADVSEGTGRPLEILVTEPGAPAADAMDGGGEAARLAG